MSVSRGRTLYNTLRFRHLRPSDEEIYIVYSEYIVGQFCDRRSRRLNILSRLKRTAEMVKWVDV